MITTEIRLVVQNEGLEIINNIVKSQKDVFLSNMINRVTNRINLNSITYLAWDYAKDNEVELINEILTELENQDYSYSVNMSKPFKWLDANYMNKKEYMLIPYAKSAKDFEGHGQALYNYLHYADEVNTKGA